MYVFNLYKNIIFYMEIIYIKQMPSLIYVLFLTIIIHMGYVHLWSVTDQYMHPHLYIEKNICDVCKRNM